MKILTQENGFITLLSIIMVSAVGLSVILAISSAGINSIKTSRDLYKSNQAKALANACAEIALQNIRDDISYNGSGNLNIGGNNCSYAVFNQGGENRIIQAESSVSDSVSKIKILIDQINPKINTFLWQEVGDF